jgi:hypothetical protein
LKALGEELFDFCQDRHDAARVVRSIEAIYDSVLGWVEAT